VKIIDLNILIYGTNEDSFYHYKAKQWIEDQLNGTDSIGIPWIVLLGFLRLMTNGKVFPNPLTENQAITILHGAALFTLDGDFSRFRGLRWEKPFS
jgi:uncharacterized protein